jgi:hypothetical protein
MTNGSVERDSPAKGGHGPRLDGPFQKQTPTIHFHAVRAAAGILAVEDGEDCSEAVDQGIKVAADIAPGK